MAYLAFADGGAGAITYAPTPQPDPAPAEARATLSPLEWLAVALSRRDGLSSLRQPGPLATAVAALFGGHRATRLADPRLEALRRIAVLSRHYGYAVPSEEVRRFLAAGFSPEQYELVVDSLSAERQAFFRRRTHA
jgi:hypothetical protein